MRATAERLAPSLDAQFGCEQFRPQFEFLFTAPRPCPVLVREARLDPRLAAVALGSVVKFSPSRYSLATHDALKLATPEHYRSFEGDGDGIKDPGDAVYKRSVHRYLDRWNSAALRRTPHAPEISGTMTYRNDASWLFCTSLLPRSSPELRALKADFDADCTTEIADTSTFARQLGSSIAQMSSDLAVTHDDTTEWIQQRLLRLHGVEQIVRVDHGQVTYCNDVERVVDAVPLQHRAAAIPFVKQLRFDHQREYRFTVTVVGTPAQDVLLVPVSEEVRVLLGLVG